jgi:hypothetical protein
VPACRATAGPSDPLPFLARTHALAAEQVMKEWIAKRVTELLGGLEEEVLIGMVYNMLEEPEVRARRPHGPLAGGASSRLCVKCVVPTPGAPTPICPGCR